MRSNAIKRRNRRLALLAVLGGGSLVSALIPARFELRVCTRSDGGCLYIHYGAQPASAREPATQRLGAARCAED